MRGQRRLARDPRLGLFGLTVAAGGFMLGLVASVVAVSVVAAAIGVSLDKQTLTLAVASSVGLWLGFLGLPIVVAQRRGGVSAFLGLRMRPLVDLPLGIVTGLASTFATAVATSAVLDKVQTDELQTKATDVIDRAQQPTSVTLLVLVLCVVTPLAEEVFFRGLVFRSLGRILPIPVAVVLAGAVFGLVHYSGGSSVVVVNQLGLLGAFGALLCILTWRTGRLGAAIVAHATFNLVTVLNVLLTR